MSANNDNRELRILSSLGKIISASTDIDELLSQVLHLASEILPFQRCAVLLLDHSKETLKVTASKGYRSSVTELPIAVGHGVTGAAVNERQPVLVSDVTRDERYIPGVEGGRCEMAAPLIAHGKVLGVIDAEAMEVGTFNEQDVMLLSTFAAQVALAIENARLFARMQQTYFDTVRSLACAIDARDPYTRGHSERVAHYSQVLASKLRLDEKVVKRIEYASWLHDIGKIGIADEVLKKHGSLSSTDRSIIEDHPHYGDVILGPLAFLDGVSALVLHHHERFDGSGYPDGLQGEEIPLEARIISVADAFDAMTSDRLYRKALSVQAAAAELRTHAGGQFDPRVVAAFVDLLEQGELELQSA